MRTATVEVRSHFHCSERPLLVHIVHLRSLNATTMFRSTLLLLAFTSTPMLFAQAEAVTTLTGGGTQQWTVIGNAATPKCSAGDATYTFSARPGQVIVATCAGGGWKNTTHALSEWNANGKSGIAFGGSKYEVKSLPPSAPACKGNATCVRLVTVPDGKTDATRTIYLTH